MSENNLNKDYLEETDESLSRLYKLVDNVPVAKRTMHDGVSQITITAKDWIEGHQELWEYLIPPSGHAKIIQGEVIRITGRVAHEVLDNGGTNWDSDHRMMLEALIKYFRMGTPLSDTLLQEAITLAKQLRGGNGDDEPARLCELAVQWVRSNPDPIPLEQPEYSR